MSDVGASKGLGCAQLLMQLWGAAGGTAASSSSRASLGHSSAVCWLCAQVHEKASVVLRAKTSAEEALMVQVTQVGGEIYVSTFTEVVGPAS